MGWSDSADQEPEEQKGYRVLEAVIFYFLPVGLQCKIMVLRFIAMKPRFCISNRTGILVTLNSCRRQLFSVTAYTAVKKYKRQLISFASIEQSEQMTQDKSGSAALSSAGDVSNIP